MEHSSGARRNRRNPARYLALVALAAVLTAIYLVAHQALDATGTQGSVNAQAHTGTTRSRRGSSTTTTTATTHASPEFYVVRAGDSLSEIASRAGVSLATIEALNPHLNANQLQPGQRVRLR